MKKLLLAAGIGLSLGACTTSGWSEAPLDDRYYAAAPVSWWGRDAVSVDIFYAPLASYGTWGLHPRYGRVFLPTVGAGWQPYSRGYWRQDPRQGRLWISSEPWGWATYHYGRWGRDTRLGWFWVPDTRFGPGWVDWRAGSGYASWAPLPPFGWNQWGGGWGNDWWVHAPGSWVYRPGLYSHVRPGRHDWRDSRTRYDRDGDDRDRYDRDRPRRNVAGNPRPPRAPGRGADGVTPDLAPPMAPVPAFVGNDVPQPVRQPGWNGRPTREQQGLQRRDDNRNTIQRSERRQTQRSAATASRAPSQATSQSAAAPAVRVATPPPRAAPPVARDSGRSAPRESARGRDVPARVADD